MHILNAIKLTKYDKTLKKNGKHNFQNSIENHSSIDNTMRN